MKNDYVCELQSAPANEGEPITVSTTDVIKHIDFSYDDEFETAAKIAAERLYKRQNYPWGDSDEMTFKVTNADLEKEEIWAVELYQTMNFTTNQY